MTRFRFSEESAFEVFVSMKWSVSSMLCNNAIILVSNSVIGQVSIGCAVGISGPPVTTNHTAGRLHFTKCLNRSE